MEANARRPFPAFAVFPTLLSFVSSFVLYGVPMALCGGLRHYDFTTALDRAVPVWPVFTPIYLSFFAVWIISYVLVGYRGREAFYRFLTADFMGRLVCTAFFVLLPTMNVRPVIESTDFFSRLLNGVVYANDRAANLFPSVHCFVAWLCFLGVSAKDSPLPRWYQALTCGYVCLILVATQVLKQHVIADLIAAVALAYGMLALNRHIGAYRFLQTVCEWVNTKLLRIRDGRPLPRPTE